MVGKKKNPLFVWGKDRKIRPSDHHLSSLGNRVMTNGDPRDEFFYPTLILMIDIYNLQCTFFYFQFKAYCPQFKYVAW